MKKYIAFVLICMAAFTACKDGIGGSSLTGEPGDLLVVINNEYKENKTGEKICEILNQSETGLTQEESPFSILLIKRDNFSSVFRSHRNILFLNIDKKIAKPQIKYRKDLWTKHQAYVEMSVNNADDLETLLTAKHDKIIDYFVQAEMERYQQLYKQSHEQAIEEAIKKKFGFDISIPNGFNLNKTTDNFMWLSLESKVHSQGLIIYERPYTDTAQFGKNALLNYRDSILKLNIPGPSEGSYMSTEYVIPISYNVGTCIDSNFTTEMRGKWRVENDFMAGPFSSYSFCSPKKDKIITVEGYVYYPNKEKRNFMRQLQSICRSISFNNQSK